MNCLLSPVVLIFLLSAVLGSYGKEKSESEHIEEVLRHLTSSPYDKRIPPEGTDGPGEPVKVTVSTYILDIHKVDDSSMDFIAEFYFRQGWIDPRLKYEQPLEFINMRDNFDKIWTPDLFFVEERQGVFHQVIHPNIFIRIYPNGFVHFSAKLSVKFGCQMDLRYYPHDSQECLINVESYGHSREKILLNWTTPARIPLSYSENITMHEFDIIAATPSVRDQFLSMGNYSNLGINLTFKRKIGFFVTRLYVPFIILVLMTSLSFWIRADERCLRLSLLLVILYLMVSISTSMNSLIPHAPYTKGSDVWIGFCQSLVFAAFLEFIIVAVIAGKESEEGGQKHKGELLLTLDPEAKELKLSSDSPKSPLTRMINLVRRGGHPNNLSYRIDRICRIMFLVIFVWFNMVYWSVYCC